MFSSFVTKNIMQQAHHYKLTPSSTANLSNKRIRGKESITRVRLEEGSLTPMNDSQSIAAIFQNSEVIQDISDDPQIRGLKLIVYE